LVGLTIIGVINSAVGAYYYLKLIVMMYMREDTEDVPVLPIPGSLAAALAITLAATIYLGIAPGPVLGYAQRSARQMLQHEGSAERAQHLTPTGGVQ
jgi:NADH-quinone oxidoreductase subunit N